MITFFLRRMTLDVFADIVKATQRDILLSISQPALTEVEARALVTISGGGELTTLPISAPHGMILRETLDYTASALLNRLRFRAKLRLALSCIRHRKQRAEGQAILQGFDHALYERADRGVEITLTCNPRVGWSSGSSSRQCAGHRHSARFICASNAARLLTGIFETLAY